MFGSTVIPEVTVPMFVVTTDHLQTVVTIIIGVFKVTKIHIPELMVLSLEHIMINILILAAQIF